MGFIEELIRIRIRQQYGMVTPGGLACCSSRNKEKCIRMDSLSFNFFDSRRYLRLVLYVDPGQIDSTSSTPRSR